MFSVTPTYFQGCQGSQNRSGKMRSASIESSCEEREIHEGARAARAAKDASTQYATATRVTLAKICAHTDKTARVPSKAKKK